MLTIALAQKYLKKYLNHGISTEIFQPRYYDAVIAQTNVNHSISTEIPEEIF